METLTETRHPVIRLAIEPTDVQSTISACGYFQLRTWQADCLKQLRDSHHWIINAPMAAGKSFEICALSADALLKDPALRVVIAVPQTIIAPGFRNNKIELPDGTRIHWKVTHDLCIESPQSSTAHLRKFLKAAAEADLMGRVLLCTHATLVLAFKVKPDLFRDVLIVIDEAHHVKHGETENQMGALVAHALEHEDLIRIGLTTATFFRGDAASIVPEVDRFQRFELPYDEYLSTCKHLRSISYDFMIDADFAVPLGSLFKERIGKTVVYIPHINSCDSSGKTADCNAVLKAIAGTQDDPEVRDTDNPVMRVRRGDQWVKVVNLVDAKLREAKKNVIDAAHESATGEMIDVIIALGMFKEGANWRWADREIIIGQRNSRTEVIQMLGRMFRDVAGKSHVEAFQLLPFTFDHADKTALRETLNDYMKAILLSLLLENEIDPAVPRNANDGESEEPNGEPRKRINYIKEAIPDETEAAAIISEITECVIDSIGSNEAFRDIEQFRDPFNHIVDVILDAHGVQEYRTEIARQVLRMFTRRTATFRGLNVGHVDVQLVKENPFDCLLRYGMETCGITTFKDLRQACKVYGLWRPFVEARELVRSLGFKKFDEFLTWARSGDRPVDIPVSPYKAYPEFTSINDWIGSTNNLKTSRLTQRCFDEAREFCRALSLTGGTEWATYCKSGRRPNDIPACPDRAYKNQGWISWSDFLGTGNTRVFRSEPDARAFIRALGITSASQYTTWAKSDNRPSDIPASPDVTYKDVWPGWGVWLGTGRKQGTRNKLSFQTARQFALTLQFTCIREWLEYCRSGRKPDNIPASPNITYRGEFVNWAHFLGYTHYQDPERKAIIKAAKQQRKNEKRRTGRKPGPKQKIAA